MQELPSDRELTQAFGGYNHTENVSDGEFFDMQNLSSDHYPIVSTRQKRGTYPITEAVSPTDLGGLIAKDTLCYVDNGHFLFDQYDLDLNLSPGEKTLISMGAYVLIFPDKVYINTKDITDRGAIEAKTSSKASDGTVSSVSYSLTRVDGTDYDSVLVSPSAPESPTDGMLWMDTGSTPHVLKQYSGASGIWTAIVTTYIKITCSKAGIFAPYSVGDGVTISGSELDALNATSIIQAKGDNYIVVIGVLDEAVTQDTEVSFSRTMPEMDFLTECNNRLWGCRYGKNAAGDVVNEIYASKLGDFKNWNVFAGISTDSYAASCGTDGAFTGAITHLGYPLFFKEDCFHKVYGNYPSNFQIVSTACNGVKRGSHRSLAIVGSTLFFQSRDGICYFDGSLPTDISSQLGEDRFQNAVAGAIGSKYYISTQKEDTGEWYLFVFDTARRLWHREENTRAKTFCACRGDLYFIDDSQRIRTVRGSGTVDTARVDWYAETGVLGTPTPDHKYISRFNIRMEMDGDAEVSVAIQYNSSGVWEPVFIATGAKLRSLSIPVRPKRCDHFRLRLSGHGGAKIYSYVKTVEEGSDML